MAYAQVTVTATATLVRASGSTSISDVLIQNQGATSCFIGDDPAVTPSTGLLLAAGAVLGTRIHGPIYAITAAGSTTIGYLAVV